MKNEKERLTRRRFIQGAAGAGAFAFVPREVSGGEGNTPPSEKINIGIIGAGGQGLWDAKQLMEFPEVRVVAVADPAERCDYSQWWYKDDRGRAPAKEEIEKYYAEQKGAGAYRGCNAYVDFNDMLEKEELDAVLVATPDNIHATASMAAMRKGLHVYCEKPLTMTVYEAQKMAELAREKKIATQMGNSGQASESSRRVAEFIADGAIGAVRQVHIWTNRPVWAQGLATPKDTPPVPDWLNWDKWLGPAPQRPYHPLYLPVSWRGWWDFGTGALGDMGCHLFHPVFRALNLSYPLTVEASYANIVLPDHSEYKPSDCFPHASIVHYEFPGRGEMPPVTLTWYDGGIRPPRPAELEDSRTVESTGTLFVGDKGKMLQGRLIPESKNQEYRQPPKTLPRSPGHWNEWINAIKGGEQPGSNFQFASMLTQVVLLGNIAMRLPNTKLRWDGQKMQFTNVPEANKFLHREYRSGWTL